METELTQSLLKETLRPPAVCKTIRAAEHVINKLIDDEDDEGRVCGCIHESVLKLAKIQREIKIRRGLPNSVVNRLSIKKKKRYPHVITEASETLQLTDNQLRPEEIAVTKDNGYQNQPLIAYRAIPSRFSCTIWIRVFVPRNWRNDQYAGRYRKELYTQENAQRTIKAYLKNEVI
jgi:hypothetical protein